MRALPILALVLAGCGNLNNADLQFLAVLPDETRQFQAPDEEGQALTADDTGTAESPLARADLRRAERARQQARRLNAWILATADRLREIRSYPPTTRETDRRTWGPFALKRLGEFGRLVVERDATFTCGDFGSEIGGFRFTFEVAKEKDGSYETLVEGHSRGGSFDHSCGDLGFDLGVWKKHGGTQGLLDPQRVDVTWTGNGDAYTLTAAVEDQPGKKGDLLGGVQTRYEARTDGTRRFDFTTDENVIVPGAALERIETIYQWQARGIPGRVDLRVTQGNAPATDNVATACWSGVGAFDHYVNPFDRLGERVGNCAFESPFAGE